MSEQRALPEAAARIAQLESDLAVAQRQRDAALADTTAGARRLSAETAARQGAEAALAEARQAAEAVAAKAAEDLTAAEAARAGAIAARDAANANTAALAAELEQTKARLAEAGKAPVFATPKEVKTVTMYQTADGALHASPQDAATHLKVEAVVEKANVPRETARRLVAAGLIAALALLAWLPAARAQSTGAVFPTPSGQFVPGSAILVPSGPIVNGQPSYSPPGQANPLAVTCTTCSPSAPVGASSNPVNGTIAVTNTFQLLIAQNASRRGCEFQNQGTHTMYFSVAASPTLANSAQVAAGAWFYCSVGSSNIVKTDQVEVAGTAGDAFSGDWQ